MLLFSVLAIIRWHTGHELYFVLLGLRDFIAAYFLFTRNAPTQRSSLKFEILAYSSSAVPLMYFQPTINDTWVGVSSQLLTIFGFSLVTLATIDLGRSFGVAPAARGTVQTGVYRMIRHPMYVGYAVAELGRVFVNPLNAVLFVVSTTLYFFRSRVEDNFQNRS